MHYHDEQFVWCSKDMGEKINQTVPFKTLALSNRGVAYAVTGTPPGINVWELISLANRHPRVNILQPGPGVGGHCIAVDPWFIVSQNPETARLIKTAREVNDAKPHWVIDKIKAKAERFKKPVIGCLGLTFKANIDDLRESPALEIVRGVIAANIGEVMACEPNCADAKLDFPLHSIKDVLTQADIIVVLVDHAEFKKIDIGLLKEKVVIDTRGIWG